MHFSAPLDSKLDGFVRKQCTESFKVRAHSHPNFVTSKTTITMYKDTDEKVTTVWRQSSAPLNAIFR